MKDEALRLALEALENMANIRDCQREKGYPLSDADKRMQEAITAIKAALEAKDEPAPVAKNEGGRITWMIDDWPQNCLLYTHLPNQEAKDEPVGWKLVPIEPTDEMLKAMDECSTEGYDERLPAGIASSVYMAAVEVAPKPPKQEIKNEPKCVAIVEVFGKDWRLDYMALPVGKHKLYAQQYTYTTPSQRTWVGLTDEEISDFLKASWGREVTPKHFIQAIEAKLKEKNT